MNTNDTLSVWYILTFLIMVTTKPISRLLKGKWLYSKDSFLKNYWLNNFNQTPRNNSYSLSVLSIVSDDFCTEYNEIRKRFSNFLLKIQVPCFVKNAENFVNTRYQNHDFRSQWTRCLMGLFYVDFLAARNVMIIFPHKNGYGINRLKISAFYFFSDFIFFEGDWEGGSSHS